MTASPPKGNGTLKKRKRVLLIAAILLLAGYTGWRLYDTWQYAQPLTLETACELKRLDDCRQIRFDILRTPLQRSLSGIEYYPRRYQYQLIMPEDKSYQMIMDYVRNNTFHRILNPKQHPTYEREDYWFITIDFYDNTDPPEGRGSPIESFYLSLHCADSSCISYSYPELPEMYRKFSHHGVSNELAGPLPAIMEQITAEKGWIDYRF